MVTAPLGASVAAKCCQTPSDRALGAVTVHAVQVPPSHTAKPKSLEAPFRYITMLSAAAPLPMSKIRSHVVELVWKTQASMVRPPLKLENPDGRVTWPMMGERVGSPCTAEPPLPRAMPPP